MTASVPAPADAVFAAITDLNRLPEWNAAMTRVVAQPAELAPGAEWVVEFRAMGRTWHSRSRLDQLDRVARSFTYRSTTDDGNPSFGIWSWKVEPDGDGALVTVTWELHPATFWRKVLLAHVRHRQLRRTEVPASIAALEGVLTSRA